MAQKKTKKFRQKRKLWFRGLKSFLRIRYRKPRFIYLGAKPTTNAIILSNHVGAAGPMILELHAEFPHRMWGTHEMNSGLRKLYRYQTRVYYHKKKGWNLHLARLFCLLASPLTNIYYRGLRLISTYQDHRLRDTLKESVEVLKGGENIVIFPEYSDEGYLEVLTKFYTGFAVLAESALKAGIDVSLYVAYLKLKENTFIFDEPILFSELKKIVDSREEIGQYLLEKCNALGQMDLAIVPAK
ncbi:MAG: hypothetical protein ACOX3K_05590 [Bacilli bacterium]|jgi:1-acyl-sn-glycerol-3-phosphate acyltransferase